MIEHGLGSMQSKEAGMLLSLEELPKFLNGMLKDLENTEHYMKNGYVFFYLATVGTSMNGPYRFDPLAKTLEGMFRPVSEREYRNLPFEERARFWPGKHRLSVGIGRSPYVRWHIYVGGCEEPLEMSSVAVVKVDGAAGGIELDAARDLLRQG